MSRGALLLLLLTVAAVGGVVYWPSLYTTAKGYLEASLPVREIVKVAAPPISIDGGRVVQVWTRGSMGHACPVSDSTAFTADHVAVTYGEDLGRALALPQIWGDRFGNAGTYAHAWSDIRRDLAFVQVVEGRFAGWFEIAKELPEVGDEVVIVGYDFDAGFVDKPKKVTVLQVLGGHLTYDGTPGPGSSGSCVLNAKGEAVGINVAAANGQGIGVLLAGGWSEVPVPYRVGGE